MKAIRFHQFGGVEVLKYEDAPDPKPGPGEALVRVKASGVNHLDLYVRAGSYATLPKLPHISGSEAAGEVAEVGEGVAGLSAGQAVAMAPWMFCGRCEYCLAGEETVCLRTETVGVLRNGSYAEYMVLPAVNLIPMPPGVSFEAAAAVTLATVTAWHMLMGKAKVGPGEKVLVHAAGSGIGSAALQIAKLAGAWVVATAGSDDKLAKAKELGADEVVNYNRQDFQEEVKRLTDGRGVDVVAEHIGQTTWEKSIGCLARNGRLVTCGVTTGGEGKMNIRYLFSLQASLLGSRGGTRADVRQVLNLVAAGKLKPVIHRVYPLQEVAEAQRTMEERKNFGKLILVP